MLACKVQFKHLGKRYTFRFNNLKLQDGDLVVVQTVRGLEVGMIVGAPFTVDDGPQADELKDVLRLCTKEDIKAYHKNKQEEAAVMAKTKEFALKDKLDMKVLGAEYTLDRQKLIVYFESDGRVDFRELVRHLADVYRTRIELRQVGSRDGAKVFGGIGPCGLVVCCKTFLTEFANVSVKMAKNQSLSLNPDKISGNCGKLLCCINYENDIYTELRQNAPDIGDIVETEKGEAKVLTCDVLNRNLKVKYLGLDAFGYLKFDDVKVIKPKNRKGENDGGNN